MPVTRYYFPDGAFDEDDHERDRLIQEWYGSHLQSMDEPRLFISSGDHVTVYRFYYLPTFDPPYIIRLSRSASGVLLTTKGTDGMGGYEPGKIVKDESAPLSETQWRRLLRALSGARFWTADSYKPEGGYDGERYIVEGYDRNHYHFVDRWSPPDGPFRNLCNRFIELRDQALGASRRRTRELVFDD